MAMLANVDGAWAVAPPRQGKVAQTAAVTYNGGVATLQLVPKSQMGSITTPWAPNVYRGTGGEERQTITLDIPQEIYEQFQRLEGAVLEKARGVVPNVDAFWHSALRPAGNHSAALKAKIHTSGRGCVGLWTSKVNPSSRRRSGEAYPYCQPLRSAACSCKTQRWGSCSMWRRGWWAPQRCS